MLQYIPIKQSKIGIMLKMLVKEAAGYVLHHIPYKGKIFDRGPQGQTLANSVLNLLKTKGFLNKFYHVYSEYFFISLELGLDRNTYCTRTLCRNRPMPQRLTDSTFRPNETVYLNEQSDQTQY